MSLEAMQLIFSCQQESETIALAEFQALSGLTGKSTWLDAGVCLLQLNVPFAAIVTAFSEKPPVFVQHMFPIQSVQPFAGDGGEGLEALTTALMPLLPEGAVFSVQARLAGRGQYPFKPFEIHARISDRLVANGRILHVKEPEWAVSVVVFGQNLYAGVSRVSENLSDWGGGRHRFAQEDGQISRAEFKLLEALHTFRISLEGYRTAVDLGAAPGGWTRILRLHGLEVTAVDPAELHPSLMTDKLVHHRKETAQAFFGRAMRTDVMVNDMKMDARDSARLMADAASSLSEDGMAILTLKLPEHGKGRIMKDALGILSKRYKVAGVRQLFHNRSEVTVWLRPLL